MKDKLLQKMFQHTIDLYLIADKDKLITGDAFVEFGERSLIVIDPKNVNVGYNKTGKIKLYGKSIIKPQRKKK